MRRSSEPIPLEDLAEVGEPRSTVIIASTHRSGSTLLATGLQASGRFGVPAEYLNSARLARAAHDDGLPVVSTIGTVRMWRRRLTLRRAWDTTHDLVPESIRPYLDHLIAHRTTPNGVFSMKIHWYDWDVMQRRFGVDESWFPQPVRWVHIRRRDSVAQAVSMVRAQQTGHWVSKNSSMSDTSLRELPAYEPAVLLDALHRVRREEAGWQSYFARHSIEPVEVVYEDLSDDYEATIRAVAAALGESVDVIEPPRIERQADALNADWTSRFLDDVPDLGVNDPGR